MTAHTPGPWVIAHENSGGGYSIRDAQGRNIGHSAAARSRDGKTLPEESRVEEPEARANGRLMAAAPALLAALEEYLEEGDQCDEPECGGCQRRRRSLATIAKARGKA